jgi:TetR/AcrR family transcriptional repressor of mexJK operon
MCDCTLEYMSSTTSSSTRKRLAVLHAAKQSFLSVGFGATNLDHVAAAAGVSKMTIYSHFTSKENLFTAVMAEVIRARSAAGPRLEAGSDPDEFSETLTAVAVDLVETVRDPEVVGLRRVLIAEQPRHPDLAAAWRDATVVATVAELEGFFGSAQRQGLLDDDADPQAIAEQFLWMLIGDELDLALLAPAREAVAPAHRADGVVRTMLAAFGTAGRR